MRPLVLGRYALSLNCTAALLAGCGGSQPPIGAPGEMSQGRAIAQAKTSTEWQNTRGHLC